MSEAKKYLEDVNQFDAFLKLGLQKDDKFNTLSEEKVHVLNSYQAIKLMLIDLGKELKNKYK